MHTLAPVHIWPGVRCSASYVGGRVPSLSTQPEAPDAPGQFLKGVGVLYGAPIDVSNGIVVWGSAYDVNLPAGGEP